MLDPTVTSDPAAMPPRHPGALDLDLRGLRCPMPVLRTRKALAALASGQVLRVACTDPLAGLDIPHLLYETGDALLGQVGEGAAQVFTILKA